MARKKPPQSKLEKAAKKPYVWEKGNNFYPSIHRPNFGMLIRAGGSHLQEGANVLLNAGLLSYKPEGNYFLRGNAIATDDFLNLRIGEKRLYFVLKPDCEWYGEVMDGNFPTVFEGDYDFSSPPTVEEWREIRMKVEKMESDPDVARIVARLMGAKKICEGRQGYSVFHKGPFGSNTLLELKLDGKAHTFLEKDVVREFAKSFSPRAHDVRGEFVITQNGEEISSINVG